MPLARLSGRPPAPGQYTPLGAFTTWGTLYNAGNPTAGRKPNAYADTWAAVRSLTAQEIDKAQQIAQRVNLLVTIPYQPGVLESMLFSYYEQGFQHMLQIAAIEDPDNRHVELRMTCFEINANVGEAS
jgi:SPP1 family predicted phage head-tail adaptor